jgi:transcriptional regulator with XRE-family HTH domain
MIVPSTFKNYILEEVNVHNLSLRKIAQEIGVSAAHLSQMLNQNTGVNPDVLNNLAILFNRERTEVYAAAGLLDFADDELLVNQFSEAIKNDKNVKDLFGAILKLDRTDRENRIRLILAAMGES